MRKLIYNAQTTLNNRIANQDGVFWEPFPWGETEQAPQRCIRYSVFLG